MSDNYAPMVTDPKLTRQEQIYDRIRRLIPIGSHELPEISLAKLEIDPKKPEDLDAFYSAIRDLEAEGYVSIGGGSIAALFRPAPSDRTKSFYEDHRARGADPREDIVGDGLSEQSGAMLQGDFPEFVTPELQKRYTVLKRVQVVDDSPWAYTISAFPFPKEDFVDLLDERGKIKQDVFHILRVNAHPPTRRSEVLKVRFPYGEEVEHLGLHRKDRIPVVQALGTVRSGNEIVELYFNIMRADRYVFPFEVALSQP